MSKTARFWLVIVLAILAAAALAAVAASLIVNGAKTSASPSLTVILGLVATLLVVGVGLLQNQSIQSTLNETHQLVNGGLNDRIDKAMKAAIVDLAMGAKVVPELTPLVKAVEAIDPHATAGA
jgi:hypothetical protein